MEYIRDYDRPYSKLKSDLAVIGDSQMDLYYGKLTLTEISQQIIHTLSTSYTIDKVSYIKLLNKNNDYYIASLSDSSQWVLRQGTDSERYIHFHPARYSPHTYRITANTLKSLIAVHIAHHKPIGLSEINHVRTKYLNLDPIRSIKPYSGIGRYLGLFRSVQS